MTPRFSIPTRYNGPPHSANGGYSAGKLAKFIDGPALVSLRSPPPLDTDLTVKFDNDRVEAWHEDTLVMYGSPHSPQFTPPTPPSLSDALKGRQAYVSTDQHLLPTCFVCGPLRREKDGLRIFAGTVNGFEGVTDVWTPDETILDEDGLVPDEIIWSALDCPSYFAIPDAGDKVLLGSICSEIRSRPIVGLPTIVVGWFEKSAGRKHYSATALFSESGELLAQADTLWISLI